MRPIASLSIEELAQRCAEETAKFNRHQSSDPQFCFELVRRALAEERAEAFTRVYQIYERQVLNWVHRHSRFAQTGESAEYFASLAWSTFYFALRGPRFGRFASLPEVLTYLKLCVHTAIAQYVRDQQPAPSASLDEAAIVAHAPDPEARIAAAELWGHICRVLPDERDRLLARCVFVHDLKPRQIVTIYPAQWASERQVSVDLYRIRRLLRNDPELRRQRANHP